MTVRAKFKVEKYETILRRGGDGESAELRTIVLTPVYGQGDTENAKFFAYTPSGKIELGTVNPEAWQEFELGEEYFVDFTKASEP